MFEIVGEINTYYVLLQQKVCFSRLKPQDISTLLRELKDEHDRWRRIVFQDLKCNNRLW